MILPLFLYDWTVFIFLLMGNTFSLQAKNYNYTKQLGTQGGMLGPLPLIVTPNHFKKSIPHGHYSPPSICNTHSNTFSLLFLGSAILKWLACLEWHIDVKCDGEGLGSLCSSSNKLMMPVFLASIRSAHRDNHWVVLERNPQMSFFREVPCSLMATTKLPTKTSLVFV